MLRNNAVNAVALLLPASVWLVNVGSPKMPLACSTSLYSREELHHSRGGLPASTRTCERTRRHQSVLFVGYFANAGRVGALAIKYAFSVNQMQQLRQGKQDLDTTRSAVRQHR